jgi:hypothetical protein
MAAPTVPSSADNHELPDYWPATADVPLYWRDTLNVVLPPLPDDPLWYQSDKLGGLFASGRIPDAIKLAFFSRRRCVRLLIATDDRPSTIAALYSKAKAKLWAMVRRNEEELMAQPGWHLPCTQFPYLCYDPDMAMRLLSVDKAAVELHRTATLYFHMDAFIHKHRGKPTPAHLDCPCMHIAEQVSWPTDLVTD